LQISFEKAERSWSLDISNTAPGVLKNVTEKIVDNLKLGKINKSNKPNGQGLGLLTCHDIALLHRGDFVVEAGDGRFCARLKIPC
jgi:light-regulated signal transduction histidine kinase (bacteriophytochrome)